jgi:hypothetical protein
MEEDTSLRRDEFSEVCVDAQLCVYAALSY